MTQVAQATASRPFTTVGPGARLAAMLLWPLLAMWVLEVSNAGMMASIVVFLVLPSIALALERPGILPSALAFSIIVGGASIAWIDDLATRNGQWLVVDPLSARLPLVDASAQSIFWAVAHFFISVIAWERIMGRKAAARPTARRAAAASASALAVLAVFLAVRGLAPDRLSIPYFYLGFGVVLILAPVTAMCLRRPELTRPLAVLAALGFYWKACYEIAALRNDWWRFPGEFVGWVEVSAYRIPVEELVFWILLFSPAIAVFWEFWSGPRERTVEAGGTEATFPAP